MALFACGLTANKALSIGPGHTLTGFPEPPTSADDDSTASDLFAKNMEAAYQGTLFTVLDNLAVHNLFLSGNGDLKSSIEAIIARYSSLLPTVEQEARNHLRVLKANLGANLKDIRLTWTTIAGWRARAGARDYPEEEWREDLFSIAVNMDPAGSVSFNDKRSELTCDALVERIAWRAAIGGINGVAPAPSLAGSATTPGAPPLDGSRDGQQRDSRRGDRQRDGRHDEQHRDGQQRDTFKDGAARRGPQTFECFWCKNGKFGSWAELNAHKGPCRALFNKCGFSCEECGGNHHTARHDRVTKGTGGRGGGGRAGGRGRGGQRRTSTPQDGGDGAVSSTPAHTSAYCGRVPIDHEAARQAIQDAFQSVPRNHGAATLPNAAFATVKPESPSTRPLLVIYDTGAHAHLSGPNPFLFNVTDIPVHQRTSTEAANGSRSIATQHGHLRLGFYTRRGQLVSFTLRNVQIQPDWPSSQILISEDHFRAEYGEATPAHLGWRWHSTERCFALHEGNAASDPTMDYVDYTCVGHVHILPYACILIGAGDVLFAATGSTSSSHLNAHVATRSQTRQPPAPMQQQPTLQPPPTLQQPASRVQEPPASTLQQPASPEQEPPAAMQQQPASQPPPTVQQPATPAPQPPAPIPQHPTPAAQPPVPFLQPATSVPQPPASILPSTTPLQPPPGFPPRSSLPSEPQNEPQQPPPSTIPIPLYDGTSGSSTVISAVLYAARLGHPARSTLERTQKATTGPDLREPLSVLPNPTGTAALLVKAVSTARNHHLTEQPRSLRNHQHQRFGELSIDSHSKFLMLVCSTGLIDAIPLRDATAATIISTIKTFMVRVGIPLHFRCDRDSALIKTTVGVNTPFQTFAANLGVAIKVSAPGVHSQNGKAERMGRHIYEVATALLEDARLPLPFWSSAVQHAARLYNVTAVKRLKNRTPFENHFGIVSDISYLRVWGSPAFVVQTKPARGTSPAFRPRVAFAVYLGPCPDSAPVTNLYYMVRSKCIVISRSGFVDEARSYVVFHRDSGDWTLRFSHTAMREADQAHLARIRAKTPSPAARIDDV